MMWLMLLPFAVVVLQSAKTERDVILAYLQAERREESRVQLADTVNPSIFELCPKVMRQLVPDKKLANELQNSIQKRAAELNGKAKLYFDLGQFPGWVLLTRRFYETTDHMRQYFVKLPGYSKDGKTAVVFSYIAPWHIHVMHEVSILVKGKGGWKVKSSDLAFYP